MVLLLELTVSLWLLGAWTRQGLLCHEAAFLLKRTSLTLSPLLSSLRPDGRKQWAVDLGYLQGEHLQASSAILSFNFFPLWKTEGKCWYLYSIMIVFHWICCLESWWSWEKGLSHSHGHGHGWQGCRTPPLGCLSLQMSLPCHS